MNVSELFKNVRALVQTGLVVDIPWLPHYEKFAGEMYVREKDFKDMYLARRTRQVQHAQRFITEGAVELPGEGSPLEKTVRAMNALEQHKDKTFLQHICDGLALWEQKHPENFNSKLGNDKYGLTFTDPTKVARLTKIVAESVPMNEALIELTKNVLGKADSWYFLKNGLRGKVYDLAISRPTKEVLERALKTQSTTYIEKETIQKMEGIANGTYGLPLSEVKDPRQI